MLDKNSELFIPRMSDEREPWRRSGGGKMVFGLGTLRHHAGTVWRTAVLCLAIGLIYVGLRPATYTASGLLLVYDRQISTGREAIILPGAADTSLVQNQVEMLRSRNVLVKVIDVLGLDRDGDVPDGASFGQWIKRLWPAAKTSGAAIDPSALILERLRTNLTAQRVGNSHVISMRFRDSDPKRAAQIVNKAAHVYLQELARAWDTSPSRVPAIRELYQSLGPSAYIVSEAEPPGRPDGPSWWVLLVASALFGAAVGASVAFLRDFFNNTFRSPNQVRSALGLPCLAVVPALNCSSSPSRDADLHAALKRPIDELARTIRDLPGPPLRSLGVTAALPREGATTLAIGLARSLAGDGIRVLLIDAVPTHLRDQGITKTELLTGSDCGALVYVSCAHKMGISSGALADCIRTHRNACDFVVVDLPPLVSGPEVRRAADMLDGILLAVKWGETDSDLVAQAFCSVGKAKDRFVGAVLTKADRRALRDYGVTFIPDMPPLRRGMSLAQA